MSDASTRRITSITTRSRKRLPSYPCHCKSFAAAVLTCPILPWENFG
jgi:hypothetical protein